MCPCARRRARRSPRCSRSPPRRRHSAAAARSGPGARRRSATGTAPATRPPCARPCTPGTRSGARVRFVRAPRSRAKVRIVYDRGGALPFGAAHGYASIGRQPVNRVQLSRGGRGETITLVIAHELGHILGLDHETRRCATMNASVAQLCGTVPPCTVLQADDVRGAIARYGGRMRARPPEFCPGTPGDVRVEPLPDAYGMQVVVKNVPASNQVLARVGSDSCPAHPPPATRRRAGARARRTRPQRGGRAADRHRPERRPGEVGRQELLRQRLADGLVRAHERQARDQALHRERDAAARAAPARRRRERLLRAPELVELGSQRRDHARDRMGARATPARRRRPPPRTIAAARSTRRPRAPRSACPSAVTGASPSGRATSTTTSARRPW